MLNVGPIGQKRINKKSIFTVNSLCISVLLFVLFFEQNAGSGDRSAFRKQCSLNAVIKLLNCIIYKPPVSARGHIDFLLFELTYSSSNAYEMCIQPKSLLLQDAPPISEYLK